MSPEVLVDAAVAITPDLGPGAVTFPCPPAAKPYVVSHKEKRMDKSLLNSAWTQSLCPFTATADNVKPNLTNWSVYGAIVDLICKNFI